VMLVQRGSPHGLLHCLGSALDGVAHKDPN
jgi:hypothetical protein